MNNFITNSIDISFAKIERKTVKIWESISFENMENIFQWAQIN